MRRHYINLSNGLEALDEVRASNESWAFTRIRSTTIERHDWWTLFMVDLGPDLLTHLALGVECVLHDRGTRRPLSKTCYYAAPLVVYVLDRRWRRRVDNAVRIRGRQGGPGLNAARYFDEVYRGTVDEDSARGAQLRRWLDYFGRYSATARCASRPRVGRRTATATSRISAGWRGRSSGVDIQSVARIVTTMLHFRMLITAALLQGIAVDSDGFVRRVSDAGQ